MQTPGYDGPLNGARIEEESYRIIDRHLGDLGGSAVEQSILKRIVHATGDPAIAETIRIHPRAVEQGFAALREQRPLIIDVAMLAAGVTHAGVDILCKISDDDTRAAASESGMTRSATAMELLSESIDNAIVAIGNAPTALFKILEMAREGRARPALVVGLPVGFVGAAESKAALLESDLTYITNIGTRGGTPMAAAAVNALAKALRQKETTKESAS